jgi:hypothetical protein
MKKIWFVGLAVATILATAPAAVADEVTYLINFNGAAVTGVGPAITGTGSATFSSLGGGAYNIASTSQLTINGMSASLTPFYVPYSGLGNPSPGNLSNFYINRQYALQGGCQGFSDDYCIPFDNVLTNVAPGTSPTIDAYGLLFQFTEGGNPVELAIWLDNVVGDPYYGDDIWNMYVGANGGGGYQNGGSWVVPLSADDGEGGIPLDITIGPEPSSLLLLGTGLLCMAGFIFWKSRLSMVKAK